MVSEKQIRYWKSMIGKKQSSRDNRVDNLEVLCKSCHSKEHKTEENFNELQRRVN